MLARFSVIIEIIACLFFETCFALNFRLPQCGGTIFLRVCFYLLMHRVVSRLNRIRGWTEKYSLLPWRRFSPQLFLILILNFKIELVRVEFWTKSCAPDIEVRRHRSKNEREYLSLSHTHKPKISQRHLGRCFMCVNSWASEAAGQTGFSLFWRLRPCWTSKRTVGRQHPGKKRGIAVTYLLLLSFYRFLRSARRWNVFSPAPSAPEDFKGT